MKKRYLIPLILLLGGATLTVIKWNTWFKNPPEAPYSTPSIPDRLLLTLDENSETSRHLSWRCDSIVTEARLELVKQHTTDTVKIPVQGEVVSSRSGKSAFYNIQFPELTPGTTYFYRVVNQQKSSPWHTFHLPQKDGFTSFIFLGDVQDALHGSTKQLFQSIHQRYPDVDFWAFAGDVIERPMDTYWNEWFQSMDSIATLKPILAATGNHEYLKGVVKTLDPRWTFTFSNPHNGPEDFQGRTFFLNFNDICYIVMDTDGIQGPSSLYQHYVWMKKVLSASTKKWKILMMHHPVYSVRDGRNNYFVRYTFRSMLEEYGVNLVLQGHDHGYSRITTKTDDRQKTCPVYIVSNCSPKRYSIGFNPIHDRLGSNITLYQYITIQGDSLHYRSFKEDHTLYDDLIIVNDGQSTQVIDRAAGIPESLDLPPAYLKNNKVDLEEYAEKVLKRMEYKKAHPDL